MELLILIPLLWLGIAWGLTTEGGWRRVVGVAMLILPLLTCGWGWFHHFNMEKERNIKFKTACQLWDQDKRVEAVSAYKDVLSGATYQVDKEQRLVAFRRIIDFESKFGDRGVAREYLVKALDDWSIKQRLSFDSNEANELLRAVRRDLKEE